MEACLMSATETSETYRQCPGCDRERLTDDTGCMVEHRVFNPTLEIMVRCPGAGCPFDILVDDAD